MNELTEVLGGALTVKEQTGSDYTARVTKIEGSTAYVQITGSDIADTPVAMTIDCKPGDTVRVRVADGRAWITGNDTSPPGNNEDIENMMKMIQGLVAESDTYLRKKISDSEGNYSEISQAVDEISIEVGNAQTAAANAQTTADGRMKTDLSNKSSSITIGSGTMTFNSNTLVVNSSKFTLDASGNATFGGTLNAAGGTFKGKMVIDWGSRTTVTIGDPSSTRPIELKNTDGSKMEIYDTGWGCDLSRLGLGYATCTGSSMTLGNGSYYTNIDERGVHSSSDKRLKEGIEDCSPNLAMQLRPVRFRFKDSEDIRYGFIAQEVQEILPGAVAEGKDGYLSLNYSELIAPVTALVLDQEKRITELEKIVAELKEALDGNINT